MYVYLFINLFVLVVGLADFAGWLDESPATTTCQTAKDTAP
jgi:hypothetical protein